MEFINVTVLYSFKCCQITIAAFTSLLHVLFSFFPNCHRQSKNVKHKYKGNLKDKKLQTKNTLLDENLDLPLPSGLWIHKFKLEFGVNASFFYYSGCFYLWRLKCTLEIPGESRRVANFIWEDTLTSKCISTLSSTLITGCISQFSSTSINGAWAHINAFV